MPWTRVNGLVDNIYGLAATVLMLRLAAPIYRAGELSAALMNQAPDYLLYGGGFIQIISAWWVLRRMSEHTLGLYYYAMLLCILSLMMWASTPFTINVMIDAVGNSADFAAATRMLSFTMFVSMCGFTGLWWRLERIGAMRPGLDRDIYGVMRFFALTTVFWPALAIALSHIDGWLALNAMSAEID